MKLVKILFMITALVTAIGWANPGFADIFTDGLQIYLPFDGDAEDQAGDPDDGSEHNISYEPGKFGEAASFNGSGSYILISPGIDIGTDDFTVSFWFKTADTDGYMLDARQGGNEIGYYLISFWSPQTGIWFGFQGNGGHIQTYSASGLDNQWHMATGVRNNKSNLLYIDGTLVQETTGDNLIDVDSPPIYLGRRYTYTSGYNYHYYQGLIDDFRLYDRALDADEVAALYEYNPVPVPTSAMLLLSGLAGLAGIKRLRPSQKS